MDFLEDDAEFDAELLSLDFLLLLDELDETDAADDDDAIFINETSWLLGLTFKNQFVIQNYGSSPF